ncbi:MAG: 4Fe-4S binding protein, partial [Clostridia bacterium]|nr:4Fe-4S binding protein [Clostridia bacterium]
LCQECVKACPVRALK